MPHHADRLYFLIELSCGDRVGALLALVEELGRADPAAEELAAGRVDEVALQLAVVVVVDPVEAVVAGRVERLDHAWSSPYGSSTPSVAPATTGRLATFLVKSCAPFLESMVRKYSRPPATFLALAGTMNGSPAVPRIASNGSLSPLPRLGVGAIGHVEAGRGDVLLLALQPGAAGDERGLALAPGGLRLDVVQAGRAVQDELVLDDLVPGVGGGLHRVGLPGVRLQVVDGERRPTGRRA